MTYEKAHQEARMLLDVLRYISVEYKTLSFIPKNVLLITEDGCS